jgi:REP element-mobilizing transposase RayT
MASGQASFHFRSHGGARAGAGRPRKLHAPRHQPRIRVVRSIPMHIVTRVAPHIGTLRRPALYHAIRAATTVVAQHAEFRIIHISIQRTHIHLIVEAQSGHALTQGMRSFQTSAARNLNGALVTRGPVLQRYFATQLRSPRQVRNTLAYVLNNWRHHREPARGAALDFFSSAPAFDGWSELGHGTRYPITRTPGSTYAPLTVWPPRTWLLTTGWRRHRLVSLFEVPAASHPRQLAPPRRAPHADHGGVAR